MNFKEKALYQQIHPLRLITDWGSGLYACYCFWDQQMLLGIAMMFVPSLVVSLFVTRFGDLEKLKNSSFGKYYQRIYSKSIDLIRFIGFIIMAAGSWIHQWELLFGGLAIILYTWVFGIFSSKK